MTDIPLASTACSGAERARFRRAVAAHFAGRIKADDERQLRTHLPACPACRRFYSRALVLSGTDPRALTARQRLARGLGLHDQPVPGAAAASRRRAWTWLLAPALGAGLTLAVAVKLIAPAREVAPPAPAPRGAAATAAPALLAYRIPPGGAPRPLEGAIGGRDELAFAYANPGALPYLLVFAVDEHAHVYWYHPAWRTGAPPPVAAAALAGPGPHEIPAATRHDFDGRRLVIYAVFARQPLEVAQIERAARAAGAADRLPLPADLQVVRRSIEVAP